MCRAAQTRYINIRLPKSRVNLDFSTTSRARPRHQDSGHRTSAMNVPRPGVVNARRPGPVPGQAERRALTTPSTARESNTRWCRRNWYGLCRAVSGNSWPHIVPMRARNLSGWFSGETRPRAQAGGRHVFPDETGCTDSDTRHGRRWRERPRLQGPGATLTAGHRGRSRHRWLTGRSIGSRTAVGGERRPLNGGFAATYCVGDACAAFAVIASPRTW